MADCWNLPATIWEIGYAARRTYGSKPVDIDEEGGCDENDDVPEEVTLGINLILKELSEMFLNMESTKDKSLEAHPSFKRSMPIHCHLEKNLHSKL